VSRELLNFRLRKIADRFYFVPYLSPEGLKLARCLVWLTASVLELLQVLVGTDYGIQNNRCIR
jgi:hypothetical protein